MSEKQTETQKPAETAAVATKANEQSAELSQEKPAAEAVKAAAPAKEAAKKEEAKEEAPKEKPFTTDVLQSCTSRFTRKAWDIYLTYLTDMSLIRTRPVRATLTARSVDGAEEIQKLLSEAGVSEMSRAEKTLSFTATFEQIQAVIKHPETHAFDAVKI